MNVTFRIYKGSNVNFLLSVLQMNVLTFKHETKNVIKIYFLFLNFIMMLMWNHIS